MITWEYRVFREDDGDYIIREVFYDEQRQIFGCTIDAIGTLSHRIPSGTVYPHPNIRVQ